MKRLWSLSLLTLTAAALGQEPPPPEWKPFSPPGGRFTVSFPGAPVEQKEKVKTPAGEMVVTLFAVELKGQGTLAAGYTLLPAEAAQPGLEQRRLDNARDGLLASVKGQLTKEQRTTFQKKFPGRELDVKVTKDTHVRTRLYAVKDRLYQVTVVGAPGWVAGKDAVRFFKSFKLTR